MRYENTQFIIMELNIEDKLIKYLNVQILLIFSLHFNLYVLLIIIAIINIVIKKLN